MNKRLLRVKSKDERIEELEQQVEELKERLSRFKRPIAPSVSTVS